MVKPGLALGLLLGVSQVVYLTAVVWMAARLLRLARRTRRVPEALLALHFVACLGLGYLLTSLGLGAAMQPGLLPPPAVTALVGAGQLGSCIGVWAAAGFTWQVFRRDSAWARAAVAALATVLAAGYAGSAATGAFARGIESGWFWLLYAAYTASAVWVMSEPLLYAAPLRRRAVLGLADPGEARRVLLWGVGSVCRFGMLIVGAVPGLLLPRLSAEALTAASSATLIATALLGLGVAASYALAFFPHPRRAAAAAAAAVS
jgi:hypothetical protein